MSDEEVMRMKAPPRPKKRGAPMRKRYLSFLDTVEKKSRSKSQKKAGKKAGKQTSTSKNNNNLKATSTRITPHCTTCRMPGHNRTKCPNLTLPTIEEV